MSEYWSQRKRDTNKLVGIAADYVFGKENITAEQLYGLCKLTWTTKNNESDDAPYISSTKIPALGLIFGADFSRYKLGEVGELIAGTLGQEAKEAVLTHTGFTHFYRAFRNSSLSWIQQNFDLLVPLFQRARKLGDDRQGLALMRDIEQLPPIPKANHADKGMRPEHLLTPAFFAMDPRLRFPLINGNLGVRNLLATLKVPQARLSVQYERMIELYGRNGISDAADLDEIGGDLVDFFDIPGRPSSKRLLERKSSDEGAQLPEKGEDETLAILDPATIKKKRIHNCLTNKLRELLPRYTLFEGNNKDMKFDVMVKRHDEEGNDLLIEVKSSTEAAHIRMAIGQVYDYWFRLKGADPAYVAILLPDVPDKQSIDLLNHLAIGLLWLADHELCTCTDWLEDFVIENGGKYCAMEA